MDLSRTRVVLRERALIDVLDLGLRFLIEHGAAYAKTAAIVLPPFFLVSEALGRTAGPIAAWTFAIFTMAFAAAPFTVLASRLVFEEDVTVIRAIGTAVRASGRLFVLRLATVGGATLGFLFFMAPAVWFLAVALFVSEVAVLEHAGVAAALTRSARIVRQGSGQAVMALLLLAILHLLVVFAADSGGRTVITALLESRAPAAIWDDGWSTLGLLGFWLFVPYLATARFLVYLDIRTRSEGWDIQTRFAALATRASAEERSAA
jgi:hypothetical protein